MSHSIKKQMRACSQSVMKQGKALLHRSPEPAPQVSAGEKAFRKGQDTLDAAARVVHAATNQKDLDKAKALLGVAQKHFNVLFKAHEKARRR